MENFGLNFKVVKAKAKSIQSVPVINVTTSKNHFVLNNVAADALDIEAGDSVMILFAGGDDENKRFFLTKAVEGEDSVAKVGSAGNNYHFNYAGIYGSILLNESERAMISIDELVAKGIMKEFETAKGNKATRALMKVSYNLELLGELDVNGTERKVFALTNRKETLMANGEEESDEAQIDEPVIDDVQFED